MKIAILGGSFNPLHIGHAMLADTVVKEYGYDKVLFIPTCIPPHKELNGTSSTKQRLEMVKTFCEKEGENHFALESCEVDRGGISYTVDTVKYVIEKYKNQLEGKPGLIMGEEIAAEFHKWKNPAEIASLCDLLIVPRNQDSVSNKSEKHNVPTGNYEGDFKVQFNPETFEYPFKMLKNPVLPVSSTEIRSRVAEGMSFKYLVPSPVFDYIVRNNLYR